MGWFKRQTATVWIWAMRATIQRYNFIVEMEMVDGTSAKGRVHYRIGFRLLDGCEVMAKKWRTYETPPKGAGDE